MTKINIIEKALESLYFAGKTNNAKLIFLASLTRFSEKPVSILIKGASGSGKSELLNTILKFIPKKDKEVFTGISEKSIAYMERNFLKHKILGIQEFSGLNNPAGNTLLRSLLSEGKIRRMVAKNDPNDNDFVNQESKVEGPVCLFMTTTEESIHPEDENRMLSIKVDQSAEQKRLVLLAKADAFNGVKKSKEIIQEMQLVSIEYQKNFKKVEIPFVKKIATGMDTSFDQVLRHFDKILSLIEAHALLNQESREIKDDKVVANDEDYSVVCSLLEPILFEQSKREVDFDIIRIMELIKKSEIKGSFLNLSPDEIDTSNGFLAKKLQMSESAVSLKCKKARKLGLIAKDSPEGKPAIYRVLRDPSTLDKVLPSWAELK
tara:strand:- start:1373 stop:2503 length:1131 start_codon:yes stop_codon:yes gene_type:complete